MSTLVPRFTNYVEEQVNDTSKLKRLSHLEELMFEEGLPGLSAAREIVAAVASLLSGDSFD